MSIINTSKFFLLHLYRVKLLRFLIFFFAILFLLYVTLAYTLVPVFLSKVLQLGVASETVLLDAETTCTKPTQCESSEVIFTLEP